MFLYAINIYLSSCKWQLVDKVIRRSTERSQSGFYSFALSSIGVAVGQILPVQVAVSLTRTLGTCMDGGGIRRGTFSTLIEQGSDVVVACFLAAASGITLFLGGGAEVWLVCGCAMIALAVVAIPAVLSCVRTFGTHLSNSQLTPATWKGPISELASSGLLHPRFAQKMFGLSVLRFIILVLMAGETTKAIHSAVPLWHLAAAIPIVVIASAVGIIPGGLGIVEVSYSGMLKLLGTPLSIGTQWALFNRLLTCVSAFAILLVVMPIVFLAKSHANAGCERENTIASLNP
jgi:uncharacterized membrane protein YbhN (UPF0104 family)